MAKVVMKSGSSSLDRLKNFAEVDKLASKLSPSKPKRKRKILKPLQRSAQDENTLVGNERPEPRRKSGKRKLLESTLDSPRKIQRTIMSYMSPVKIYRDPDTDSETKNDNVKNVTDKTDESKSVGSDTDSELAEKLMVQEEVPVEYWKEVAEQRREALAEALDENEKLHGENEQLNGENAQLKEKVVVLTSENEGLKSENEGLKGMAEKAEYFANMVNLLMTEENVDGTDSDSSTEKRDSDSTAQKQSESNSDADTEAKS